MCRTGLKSEILLLLLLLSAWVSFSLLRPPCLSSRFEISSAARLSDHGDNVDDTEIKDAIVKRRKGEKFKEYKPKDDRDRLPYDVYVASPPWNKVGRFALPPTTSCGDMIHHRSKSYIIRRVSCHYKFRDGSYRMYRKEAHAVELIRAATERIVERMVVNSDKYFTPDDV